MATVSAGLNPERDLQRPTGGLKGSVALSNRQEGEEPHLVEKRKVSSMKLSWMEKTEERELS